MLKNKGAILIVAILFVILNLFFIHSVYSAENQKSGTYEGILTVNFDKKILKVNSKGDYLNCTISAYELVGSKKAGLTTNPKVTIITSTGKRKNVTVSRLGIGKYSFNCYLSNLAQGVSSFSIEIASSNKYNTSSKKKKTFKIDTNNITGIYGTSYLGTNLTYRRLGNGSKILFVVAAQHGFEDAWQKDRQRIGNYC